jgi:phosphopantothenoylcysteine decarboxylase/phosphopantothenate--cysteine ligase
VAVDPAETPVVFVPSMNATMYENPAVRANRATLRERGYALLAPGEGALACGEVGIGRWPGNEFVLAALDRLLNGRGRLAGRRVVVTAGPTQVDIDPVRVVTNRSSGRMGFAVAEACWREGADVVVVHGQTGVGPPPFVRAVAVRTPEEMSAAVREEMEGADQLWMAAAVSDWRPVEVAERKLKKSEWDGVLRMERTEDILAGAAVERAPGTSLVGFALETNDVSEAAAEKLSAKGCDWLVVNDPGEQGAGFEHETNRVFVLGRDGSRTEFDLMSKRELARRLVDLVLDRAAAGAAAQR